MEPLYEVIVGNIGTVHVGNDRAEASRHFREYVEQSMSGVGRAGCESVTMMKDGEPVAEFTGENDL